MVRSKKSNFWNSKGWLIIGFSSILILIILSILTRTQTYKNNNLEVSRYLSLFQPVKYSKKFKKDSSRYIDKNINDLPSGAHSLCSSPQSGRERAPGANSRAQPSRAKGEKPQRDDKLDARSPGYMSKSEAECKVILEKLFGKEFNKIRPAFLKNDVTGKNLELDLYNPELKLCIEVNGKQHYQYTPYFHTSKDSFYNQRYRDEMKKTKCRENGINYIEIPYNIKLSELEKYIKIKCKDFGYDI
jgi:hypothetical protein